MDAIEFVKKWGAVALTEKAGSQSHFIDVCRLVGHGTPVEIDPQGEFFTFEAGAEKSGGKQGWADVYYRNRFIWEYKGPHKDLDAAYQQLLLYRESLGNPPLLITSDMNRIILHTNFTNTVKEVHTITLEDIGKGRGVALLKRAFNNPESFKPARTQEQVTKATADTFVAVADTLRKWAEAEGKEYEPERVAHFLNRLFFALFAEDIGLLPENVFTELVLRQWSEFSWFTASLHQLFRAMREGGAFGFFRIPHFNGGLFDDDYVPEMPGDIMEKLARACRQDWAHIEPSIFGTLFERVIDEEKRAQLGAHYTSKDDIMLIVEPVLMRPLRDRWQQVKQEARFLLNQQKPAEAEAALTAFAREIAGMTVLDPACGSGNFLYVALRQLLDLQKEVIAFAGREGLAEIPLTVGPEQLFGIEINPYAHELAQVTVWIGYLQWRMENGFSGFEEPILRPLNNIERKDAILAYDAEGKPVEPEWPAAKVVIGNPPFLGNKKMRTELGDRYVEDIRVAYVELPNMIDLVVYWFDRARKAILTGKIERAGLLATQSIRMGMNRFALEEIKRDGDIFLAWSDRPWIVEGADVRVSIIGFDKGIEATKLHDGNPCTSINADLTIGLDTSRARVLLENLNLTFQGVITVGPFELDQAAAAKLLSLSNPNPEFSNGMVVRPWINALDVTRRPKNRWVIDFREMTFEQASKYAAPFAYVERNVRPERGDKREKRQQKYWWRFARPRPALQSAVADLSRYIVTPRVAKHRLFTYVEKGTVPDTRLYAIAREDDYFFGVLHSRMHEAWSLATSSRHGVGNDPTYNNTTCFETFPFPWPPGKEPPESEDASVFAIAEAARRLDALRQGWLHPPAEDIGVLISERMLNQRTLTNLYNALTLYRQTYKGKSREPEKWKQAVKGIISLEQIEELDYIHQELDRAVLAAYGWPAGLGDEEILERLLALNLERAASKQNPGNF